ncbi:MAG: serine/threonine-protein phosphatase [Bdellovibrionales bacterium]|nr:serine/threonine-protein phosphatase [Bdellovibrionales bacterium]
MKKLNETMEAPEYFDLPGFRVSLFTSRGSKSKKKKNEDSCGFTSPTPNQMAMVVSDGMGGHEKGDQASRIVVNSILGRSSQKRRPYKPAQVIEKLEKAHQKIINLSVNAGATAVVAIIQGDGLWFYSVGDSLGYFFRPTGELIYKTFEHSVTGFATESGLMGEKEAQSHDQSNIILNSLGFHDSRIESSFKLPILTNDIVFLCSDGITELFTQEEVKSYLANESFDVGLRELAAKAVSLREAKTYFDDLTFVVCQKK